ncbi:MAG TPA: hypothetical protein DDW50_15460 [Firmicutes bacterium]|nr:hypothetical protein [Bacillota bacterium]
MSFRDKIGFMQDRFTQGIIAGIIGWFFQAVFTLSLFALKVSKLAFADFGAVLAFNHRAKGVLEFLLAEWIVLVMQAALGGVFAWWMKGIASANILIKGAFFGGFAWFTIFTIATLYKLPKIYPIGSGTAAIILTGSLIYGVMMAWGLLIINRKFGVKN